MKTRKDFIDGLHENEQFKRAMSMARTPAEKKMVADMVEGFVAGFADVLGPLIARAENDPVFAEQLGRSIIANKDVVSSNEPATSGSNG